jgi:hypothetical protein
MRNTGDVTGGKPMAVSLQFISGGDAVNPLVACYDSRLLRHPWKKERGAILLFCPRHHFTTSHHQTENIMFLKYSLFENSDRIKKIQQ